MDKRKFVYVIYIATTPEKLWSALTSGDFTEQYWGGARIQSDWKIGSPVHHVKKDGGTDWQGEILEYDPSCRLSYTFQSPGPKEDRPSRVVFELEHVGPVVKLTLTHDELDEKGMTGISRGWPAILSDLKTLLEVGRPLVFERWF